MPDQVIPNNSARVHLELHKGWFSNSIRIIDPPELRHVKAGGLPQVTANVWDPQSAVFLAGLNVRNIRDWMLNAIASPIAQAIASLGRDVALTISAAPKLTPELLLNPWEVLQAELTPVTHRVGDTGVIRAMSLEAAEKDPTAAPVSDRLRVAMTWANPYGDIAGLDDHLTWYRAFADQLIETVDAIEPCEFTTIEWVRDKIASHAPHLWYHIGHGMQKHGQRVSLAVGKHGNPALVDMGTLRDLLHQIGPPRVSILCACALLRGYEANPMLGVSQLLTNQMHSIVAMQTQVPVTAATDFAETTIKELANGVDLLNAVTLGRRAILKNIPQPEILTSFAPYIPVLLQRGSCAIPFAVDFDKRAERELRYSLAQHIDPTISYIERQHDLLLRDCIAHPKLVAVCGPSGCGKSTSVVTLIRELLSETSMKVGSRPLYFKDVANKSSGGNAESAARDLHRVMIEFARRFASVTEGLLSQLTKPKVLHDPENWIAPVFIEWIRTEVQRGRKPVICFDDLQSSTATLLLTRLASLMKDEAAVIAIFDDHDAAKAAKAPLVIHCEFLTDLEIADALRLKKQSATPDEIQNAVGYTNRHPLLLVRYLDESAAASATPSDMLEAFIRGEPLTSTEHGALELLALCKDTCPVQVLRNKYTDNTIETLVRRRLVFGNERDEYAITGAIREHFKAASHDRASLHSFLCNNFQDLADAQRESLQPRLAQEATRFYNDAFDQALMLINEQADLNLRDDARNNLAAALRLAEILHEHHLHINRDVSSAIARWELYRDAAANLEVFGERSSDYHYAECLATIAHYDESLELLEQVTLYGEIDEIQMSAYFLRHNVLKDRGGTADFEARIAALQNARAVGQDLRTKAGIDTHWLNLELAKIQHTLGNSLGYGENANPVEAIEHLEEAIRLTTALQDEVGRCISQIEQIEIRRYHGMLTDQERAQSIELIKGNLAVLAARDARRELIMHLYELGRLSAEQSEAAEWFRRAASEAVEAFPQLRLHANIRWRLCQLEFKPLSFPAMAPLLEKDCDLLQEWTQHAWSRRLLRNALTILAKGYAANDPQYSVRLWRRCADMAALIVQHGEGRNDRECRKRIAVAFGQTALTAGMEADARRAAALLQPGVPAEELNLESLRRLFFP